MIHTVTGEFDAGKRTQKLPWSTPLTHNSWKVACAETDAAREATKVAANNILILRKYKQWCDTKVWQGGFTGSRHSFKPSFKSSYIFQKKIVNFLNFP